MNEVMLKLERDSSRLNRIEDAIYFMLNQMRDAGSEETVLCDKLSEYYLKILEGEDVSNFKFQ